MEADIQIKYRNTQEAEAVTNAVSPDNVKVPSGLYIKTMRSRSTVHTFIHCETRLQTLIATIDDLLACVSVAEKSFKVAKNKP
ncbi:MAG: KEOPS complex subunit Pcc1 [Candidatus Bathyarchaeota archaeon]